MTQKIATQSAARSPKRKPARIDVPPEPIELTIDRLGGRGDGIATWRNRIVYLPFALPGERVLARLVASRSDGWTGRVESVIEPAAERQQPSCPLFTRCGGCSLQHLAAAPYAEFKRQAVIEALGRKAIRDVDCRTPLVSPPASRRRLTLAARRTAQGVIIGFNAAGTHHIVPIPDCPVALPVLNRLLPVLPQAALGWLDPGGAAELSLTASGTDLDLLITADRPLDLARRESLAAFADAQDLARISWSTGGTPEPVLARRRFEVRFGGVPVLVPPGGFLQATLAGEQAIQAALLEALPAGLRIADLYAGSGTLSLPLARRGDRIQAFERDGPALSALDAAARAAGLGALGCHARDLDSWPLEGPALAAFDAIVLDPPRAGAAAQVNALATVARDGRAVPLLAMVSCHPGSFARDARTLIDAGYRLNSVQPIDQFLWSSHIELVGIFHHAGSRHV